MSDPIIILGAGLSGLALARMLHDTRRAFRILESRPRAGGRVLSLPAGNARDEAGRFDLGPTWFWPDFQPAIAQLISELGLERFEQYGEGEAIYEDGVQPPMRIQGFRQEPASFRVRGGMQSITDALLRRLPEQSLRLNTRVRGLVLKDGFVEVASESEGRDRTDRAACVVSTLPPRLFAGSLDIDPPPEPALLRSLAAVPTWMAGHAKLVAVYDRPFWREAGLSGQAFSRRGPMAEVHDASASDDGPFALFGFVGWIAPARIENPDTVRNQAVAQLVRLFGDAAGSPSDILYMDWASERDTAVEADFVAPLNHPEYGPSAAWTAYTEKMWQGRLMTASTEFAGRNGGYLDGAVVAAADAYERLSIRASVD